MNKIGILLINLGTPNSPSVKDVRKYLNGFLMDGRVINIHPILRALLVKGFIVPFSISLRQFAVDAALHIAGD